MPNRIDKLLAVLAWSKIPEKNVVYLAILKRRPDASAERLKLMEEVLSYDKKTAFKQEKQEFRLYSRLALVLAGIVRSPSFSAQELRALRSQFDGRYGDAGYAKGEFAKLKNCAWSVQKYKFCAITAKVFAGAMEKVNIDADTVERLSGEAMRVARNTLQCASNALEREDKETLAHYERWFGKYDQRRYARVEEGVAAMNDVLASMAITLHWTAETVWGQAVPDGIRTQLPLLLGWKFFSDTYSCVNSTDKAVTPNWAATEKTYAKDEELKAEQNVAIGNAAAVQEKIYQFEKRNPGAVVPNALTEQKTTAAAAKTAADQKHEQFKEAHSRKISRHGTLIHELSHWALSTTDASEALVGNQKQDCYGTGLCARLAELKPALATNNADNYRIFCEQYGP